MQPNGSVSFCIDAYVTGGVYLSNIGFIVISDQVYKHKEKDETVIVNPIAKISPERIPSRYTFFLSFGLINLKKDCLYEVDIFAYNPHKEKLWGMGFSLQMKDEAKKENNYSIIHTSIDDIALFEEGVFSIDIIIKNTNEVKTLNFLVEEKGSDRSEK